MLTERSWLSLREAADRLGVHMTTLRRWADNGDIRTTITPGGHRRFDAQDLAQFAEAQRQARPKTGISHVWQNQALMVARRGIAEGEHPHWLATMPEQIREQNRQLGRRLLGLMMTYISLEQGGDELLIEAQAIGREYAASVHLAGLSLIDATQALLFYRDLMVESAVEIIEVARIRPEMHVRLVRRINTLVNTVQLSLMSAYAELL